MCSRIVSGYSFMEMRWSSDNGATFSDPGLRRRVRQARSGVRKLYELPSGQLLAITRVGSALNSPALTIARPFDVSANQFGSTVIVDEGKVLCLDAARTASGRQFVTSTFGDPGMPPTGVDLRYSDDGGLTWSDPLAIPGISPTDECPVLAASDDENALHSSVGCCPTVSQPGRRQLRLRVTGGPRCGPRSGYTIGPSELRGITRPFGLLPAGGRVWWRAEVPNA